MVRILAQKNDDLRRILPQMARLRIAVFREWPYLYDGTLDYEEQYLGHFIEAPDHVAICAFDGDQLVGMATASPLKHQYKELIEPLQNAGYAPGEVFYFGESILLPAYRGQGIGHKFFDGREAHAKACGYSKTTFCAVVRPDDHPLKDAAIRPLKDFWMKRGYRPLDGVIGHFSWRDIGDEKETAKPMQFWGQGF